MFGESDSDEVESPRAQPEPQRVPVIPVPKQAAVEPASDQDAQQPAGEDDDDEGWDDDEPKKPEVPAAPMDIKAQLNAMFSRGFIPQAPKQTAPADDEEGQPEQAPQASAAPEEGKRHRRHRKGEREKDGKSRHRHHHHRKGRDAEAQPQTAQQKQQALFGAEDEDGDIFARDNKFSVRECLTTILMSCRASQVISHLKLQALKTPSRRQHQPPLMFTRPSL